MTQKKSKTKKIHQAHGKEENFQPTTLEQIWGDTGMGKYKTLNESEYSNSLKDMNKSDLQAHAAKVGVIPVDNREMLTKRLLKEFKTHVASFRKPKDLDEKAFKPSKNLLKILAEGR